MSEKATALSHRKTGVHYREIRGEGFKTLTEGQQVEFGLVTRDKGTAAEDVVPTD